jgi:Na+-transporting NADH:ubiquinone oxidoreductase subunit NqrA
MRLQGGYNVRLEGRPEGSVEVLPEPNELYLPLESRRFSFSELKVVEGDRVYPGRILAEDPACHSVPLLAPRAGTVRLGGVEGHITLEDITEEPEEPYHPDEDAEHVPKGAGSGGMKRYKLLELGAWQFVRDAHTGELPDPFAAPRAVIVSTVSLEPFVARGDVQILKRLSHFTRGLEHLQSLVEYQPIYLVMPDLRSDFAREVRERLRGYAWVKMIEIPLKYPYDDFAVLARSLGLKKEPGVQSGTGGAGPTLPGVQSGTGGAGPTLPGGPVWGIGSAGVLAIDRALTLSRPCTVRIVSIAGPAVEKPLHLKAMPGYPLKDIIGSRAAGGDVRVICGGALRGTTLGSERLGLDAECEGLTVLPEHTDREFLGFMRPGFDRRSFSRNFLSSLRPAFSERFTTALRGERRPCVSCGFCEDVCPAGIMPHLIHKYLYKDDIEGAEKTRIDLCVECGLCSYVCPGKIELREQFIEAKETILRELHAEEVTA